MRRNAATMWINESLSLPLFLSVTLSLSLAAAVAVVENSSLTLHSRLLQLDELDSIPPSTCRARFLFCCFNLPANGSNSPVVSGSNGITRQPRGQCHLQTESQPQLGHYRKTRHGDMLLRRVNTEKHANND